MTDALNSTDGMALPLFRAGHLGLGGPLVKESQKVTFRPK